MKALKIVISSSAVFALSSLVLAQTTPQSSGAGADTGTSGCCAWKDTRTQRGHKPVATLPTRRRIREMRSMRNQPAENA